MTQNYFGDAWLKIKHFFRDFFEGGYWLKVNQIILKLVAIIILMVWYCDFGI
jgi:hypothetical protein